MKSVKITPVVKNFNGEHTTEANTKAESTIEFIEIEQFKEKLFELIRPWISNKAIGVNDENGQFVKYTASSEEPSIDDLHSFCHIIKGGRKYVLHSSQTGKTNIQLLTQTNLDNMATEADGNGPITVLSVMRYGNQLGKMKAYEMFYKSVLQPREVDRSGAAAEIIIKEVQNN